MAPQRAYLGLTNSVGRTMADGKVRLCLKPGYADTVRCLVADALISELRFWARGQNQGQVRMGSYCHIRQMWSWRPIPVDPEAVRRQEQRVN